MNLAEEQQKMRDRHSAAGKETVRTIENRIKERRKAWDKGFIDDKEAAKIYKEKQRLKKINRVPGNANVILNEFWSDICADKPDRLGMLRHMASVCISPIGISVLKRRRRSFDSIKNSKFPILNNLCWCCEYRPAVIRHHIIQLQNGGPVTTSNNIVYLCNTCHSDVHPWLGVPKALLLPDFNLGRVKADVSDLLEKAAKGRITREVAESTLLGYLHSVFNTLEKDK